MMDSIKTSRGPVAILAEVATLCGVIHGLHGVPVERLQTLIDLCYKWGVVDGMERLQGTLDAVATKLRQ